MKFYDTIKRKNQGVDQTLLSTKKIRYNGHPANHSLYLESYLKRRIMHYRDAMDFCHFNAAYTNVYSEDDTSYEYSCLHKVPMATAIQRRRYDLVRSNLSQRRFPDDPNEEIPFSQVYMTGLEYSVYTSDWKMAILFFVHSADPSYNCFDGTIVEETQNEDVMAHAICRTHPAFLRESSSEEDERSRISPVSGFKGLYCLLPLSLDDNTSVTRCSLWLMEKSYQRLLPLATASNIRFTRYCLSQIGAKTVWNTEFTYKVFTTLNCLHRVGHRIDNRQISNDIALNILEFVLDDILLDTIWEGLRYVSDCAANP